MRSLLAVLFLAASLATRAAEPAPAEPIVEWNERVLAAAEAEDGFLTLKGLRTAAMMHIAMHDALANIDGRHRPYLYDSPADDAAPLAAIAQAAAVVAGRQYADRKAQFDALRDRQLDRLGAAGGRDAGLDLGEAAARAILAHRDGDGWDSEAKYSWHPMGPGVYAEFEEHSGTPKGFVFGAGWAKARPFALEAQDQFRAPPPPAIESAEYTRAYNEVADVGRYQTLNRTPDQTHIALWWKDFAENSHNRLARDLVLRERLSLEEAARLFALLNIGIYDGYVSVFDNKFHYNHWRPYTAIRWAANDGNPDTVPDETWDNLHRHTYAFPSYPSAHGTACAAAMSAFTDVFGDDYAFTMRIPQVDVAGPFSAKIRMSPPTRSFESFSAAARECALSRVYLGIHFRYDSTAGVELGERIGRYVIDNYLRMRNAEATADASRNAH
jgi:hypothetical protein